MFNISIRMLGHLTDGRYYGQNLRVSSDCVFFTYNLKFYTFLVNILTPLKGTVFVIVSKSKVRFTSVSLIPLSDQ